MVCRVGWFVLLFAVSLLVPAPGAARERSESRWLRRNARVARAIKAKRGYLKALFRKRGLPYPPKRVLIRIFKQERALELWGQGADGHYAIVKSYPVCAASGDLGPKRRQGDLQVPEGFYHVRVFNPWSAYHLSLGINYPNKSDRLLGYRRNLGGAIMIHGDCVSIGCVAITDAMASEVYLAAAEARLEGKRRIPVHIFPTRLNEKGIAWLAEHYAARPELIRFWRGLKPGYDHFERHRTLPRIQIDRKGRYVVRKPKRRAGGSSVKTAGKTTQTL